MKFMDIVRSEKVKRAVSESETETLVSKMVVVETESDMSDSDKRTVARVFRSRYSCGYAYD